MGALNRPVSRGRWLLALVVASLIPIAASLTPFVGEPVREAIMSALAPVCHQIPSRSFHIAGVQLAVCHRCLGIYGGLAVAASAFLLVAPLDDAINRRSRTIIALSLVPLALDWGGEFLTGWSGTPMTRLVTGGLFGIVTGYFLTRAIVGTRGAAKGPEPSSATGLEDAAPWKS